MENMLPIPDYQTIPQKSIAVLCVFHHSWQWKLLFRSTRRNLLNLTLGHTEEPLIILRFVCFSMCDYARCFGAQATMKLSTQFIMTSFSKSKRKWNAWLQLLSTLWTLNAWSILPYQSTKSFVLLFFDSQLPLRTNHHILLNSSNQKPNYKFKCICCFAELVFSFHSFSTCLRASWRPTFPC